MEMLLTRIVEWGPPVEVDGAVLPCRFFVQWPAYDGHGPRVSAWIEYAAGMWQATEVSVTGPVDQRHVPDRNPPVRANDLRAVARRLDQMVAAAVLAMADCAGSASPAAAISRDPGGDPWHEGWYLHRSVHDYRTPADPAAFREATGRRFTRTQITTAHLGEVASTYRAGGRYPTQAVMDRFGKSHATASRWVAAARAAGLLPPR